LLKRKIQTDAFDCIAAVHVIVINNLSNYTMEIMSLSKRNYIKIKHS